MVVNAFVFRKYRAESIIDLSKGGIFLKGKASELIEEVEKPKEADSIEKLSQQSEFPKISIGNAKIYRTVTLVLGIISGGASVKMKCEKVCSVFHFDNMQMLKETLMNIEMGKAEATRSSFRTFSVMQKNPRHDEEKREH